MELLTTSNVQGLQIMKQEDDEYINWNMYQILRLQMQAQISQNSQPSQAPQIPQNQPPGHQAQPNSLGVIHPQGFQRPSEWYPDFQEPQGQPNWNQNPQFVNNQIYPAQGPSLTQESIDSSFYPLGVSAPGSFSGTSLGGGSFSGDAKTKPQILISAPGSYSSASVHPESGPPPPLALPDQLPIGRIPEIPEIPGHSQESSPTLSDKHNVISEPEHGSESRPQDQSAPAPPVAYPYPDVTTMVNSNSDMVLPMVESQFVDKTRCTVCGKKIARDMIRHMRTHHLEARFKCQFMRPYCNHKTQQFNRPYDFKKHLLNRHFQFDNKEVKRFHNLSNKLNQYGTCQCGERFLSDDWLENHILTSDPSKQCTLLS